MFISHVNQITFFFKITADRLDGVVKLIILLDQKFKTQRHSTYNHKKVTGAAI